MGKWSYSQSPSDVGSLHIWHFPPARSEISFFCASSKVRLGSSRIISLSGERCLHHSYCFLSRTDELALPPDGLPSAGSFAKLSATASMNLRSTLAFGERVRSCRYSIITLRSSMRNFFVPALPP